MVVGEFAYVSLKIVLVNNRVRLSLVVRLLSEQEVVSSDLAT